MCAVYITTKSTFPSWLELRVELTSKPEVTLVFISVAPRRSSYPRVTLLPSLPFVVGVTSQGELKFGKDQELAVFFQRETGLIKLDLINTGPSPRQDSQSFAGFLEVAWEC